MEDFNILSTFPTTTSVCCPGLGGRCDSIKKIKRDYPKMTSPRQKGEEANPKLATKSDIGGRGYIQIVTSLPKKVCISFYFLLVFGQCCST